MIGKVMRFEVRWRIVAIAIIGLFLIGGTVSGLRGNAQSFYGSLVGTVTDTSGAVVPGAAVTVTNIGTNEAHTVKAEANGNFAFVNLVPAEYKLEVQAESFKKFVRTPIPVQVGSAARIDVNLEVGAATETVEVTTAAPLLQTESGQMGQMVEGTTVQEMPLNGRNTMNLIALTAGVVPQGASMGGTTVNQVSGNTNQIGWGNYAIGGGLAGQSATYVDGVAINTLGNNVSFVPTQDIVQEFNVASSAVSADFGRFAGGVVNMTTKSGTNKLHGSVYEYFRNTVLNGNDWFLKKDQAAKGQENKPNKYNQNQYGVAINGPIVKDKAFFMFSWEDLTIRKAIPSNGYVPNTAMKAGKIPMRAGITITDPKGNCVPVNKTTYWDLTGCSSSFNQTTQMFKEYYPNVNTGDIPATVNVIRAVVVGNDQRQFNGRVDYSLSANQRLFGRYSYWDVRDIPFNMFTDAKYSVSNGATHNNTQMVVVGDTYTFNPTTILDVRVNWLRQVYDTVMMKSDVDEASFFPSTGNAFTSQLGAKIYPSFGLKGDYSLYSAFGRGGFNYTTGSNYQASSSLTKILGQHTFKAGLELRMMDLQASGSLDSGAYNFTKAYTKDEWADFLLGYANSGKTTLVSATTTYNYYQAYYLQDSWQFNQRLTLSLGIRYEFPGSLAEKKDKLTVFMPDAIDPNTGVRGTLAMTNSALYGNRTIMPTPKRELAPRVSFAYRIGSNMVVRGGYGVTYLPSDIFVKKSGAMTSILNSAPTSYDNSTNNYTPASANFVQLTNPFPSGLNKPSGRSNPAFMNNYVLTSNAISGALPTNPFSYAQQWNLSVSRQVKGDLVVDAGYSGSKGTHLAALAGGIDQLPSAYWADGDLNKTSMVTLPSLNTPSGTSKVVTLGRSRQPFPYYQSVTDTNPNWAASSFHSLQVKVQKRFSNGGLLMGSYTWGKLISDTDTQNGNVEAKSSMSTSNAAGYGTVQNNADHSAERSISSYNPAQRGVVSYVMPLPFGKGKKYLGSANGLMDRLVGGWAINGITTFQSGSPMGLSDTNQTTNNLTGTYGAGTLRPNYNPNASGCNSNVNTSGSSRDRMNKWFNTACFEAPGNWALGNAPRVDGRLKTQGIDNFDISILKSTKVTEGTNVEFRGEFFNIANRTQFAPPGTQRGSASQFGVIQMTANSPRLVQFSLRVKF